MAKKNTDHLNRPHKGVMPIPEMLANSAREFGDKLAMERFVDGKWEKFSYRDMDKLVTRIAGGLMELGLKKGDHIGVLGENRPRWGACYIAVQRMGGITVPLDSMMSDPEIHHIIKESGVKAVLVTEKFLGTVLEAEKKGLKVIDIDNGGREGAINFDDMLIGEAITPDFPKVSLEDIAAIIFTSGTTGHSKGIVLTQNNIMSNVSSVYGIININADDSLVSVLPLHHTFEATCGFLFPLYVGCSITYARSLKSKELIEDIKNSGTTLMVGVPLLYEKMYQGISRKLKALPFPKKNIVGLLYKISKTAASMGKPDMGKKLFHGLREKAGLNSVKYFVSGGAALPPYIAEFFNTLGIKLFQGYGLTETSPCLTVIPPHAIVFTSGGKAIPGVEITILDPNQAGIGEIAAKGPNIFKEYYKNPEATAETFQGEWYKTGDLGWIDDDGYLYITGRKKNLLVTSGGKNVYPEEIESLLNKSDYILESLVLGVQKAGSMGDEIEAMIVPDTEFLDKEAEEKGIRWTPELIEAEIKKVVAEVCSQLADYKRIKRFSIHTEELVKTSTKKIKRYLYQQKYLDVNGTKKK